MEWLTCLVPESDCVLMANNTYHRLKRLLTTKRDQWPVMLELKSIKINQTISRCCQKKSGFLKLFYLMRPRWPIGAINDLCNFAHYCNFQARINYFFRGKCDIQFDSFDASLIIKSWRRVFYGIHKMNEFMIIWTWKGALF